MLQELRQISRINQINQLDNTNVDIDNNADFNIRDVSSYLTGIERMGIDSNMEKQNFKYSSSSGRCKQDIFNENEPNNSLHINSNTNQYRTPIKSQKDIVCDIEHKIDDDLDSEDVSFSCSHSFNSYVSDKIKNIHSKFDIEFQDFQVRVDKSNSKVISSLFESDNHIRINEHIINSISQGNPII